MARPREFDYDQALDAAMDQFWLTGYEATSLSDLLDAMGLQKGSFYAAFGSKRDLFISAMKRYLAENLRDIRRIFDEAWTVRDGVREFLTSYLGRFHRGVPVPRGCFAVNTVTELGPRDEEIRELISSHFRQEVAIVCDAIAGAQLSGEISSDADPDALAEMIIVLAMGLMSGTKGPFTDIDDERLTELVLTHFQ